MKTQIKQTQIGKISEEEIEEFDVEKRKEVGEWVEKGIV